MYELMLYLTKEQYDQIRQQAFNNRVKMSPYVISHLFPKNKQDSKQVNEYTNTNNRGDDIKKTTPSTAGIKNNEKPQPLCKHGFPVSLCKFGCK